MLFEALASPHRFANLCVHLGAKGLGVVDGFVQVFVPEAV